MKSLSLILAACLFLPTLACADDKGEKAFLTLIRSDMLIADSRELQTRLETLDASLRGLQNQVNVGEVQQLQHQFGEVVRAWKSVETTFVAGAIDADYLDHPRYIDFFHQGNESINQSLERILNSDESLKVTMFKHSTRSINALDYLLFPAQKGQSSQTTWQVNSARRIEMALLVTEHLSVWIDEIADFYQSNQQFVNNADSLAALINALVSSSYKLKNWRVGEAGGLVEKYQGRISAARLEYPFSGYSATAIQAILESHRRVFEIGVSSGLFYNTEGRILSEISFIQQRINQALKQIESIDRPLAKALGLDIYEELFKSLSQLHDAYYFMLIDALGIQSKIVDADGD